MTRFLLLLVFLATAITASAQPVFTSTEFTSIFLKNVSQPTHQIFSIDTVNLTKLAAISGENKSWDFRSISISAQSDNTPDSVAAFSPSMPFATEFPSATYAEIYISNGVNHYSYIAINESGYYVLGTAADTLIGGSYLASKYDPPLRYFALPAMYQTSWANGSKYIGGSSDTNYREIDSVEGFVDGWGELSVPGTNAIPCLRTKFKTIYLYSSPTSKDTSIRNSFIWFTPSGVTITVSTDTSGTAYSANIAIPTDVNSVDHRNDPDSPSIVISNNPISQQAEVLVTISHESEARISVMDIMGRQTTLFYQGRLTEGVNHLPFDVSQLPNGTYFLHVESLGLSATTKVIIAH